MEKELEIIEALWRDLGEKTDRNSPVEYPEMCLITFEEFRDYMLDFIDDMITYNLTSLKRNIHERRIGRNYRNGNKSKLWKI